MGPLGPPEPLPPHHDVSRFSSGVPTLDAWLRGKARLNEAKGGARTYVACDGDRVAGFYSLAASCRPRDKYRRPVTSLRRRAGGTCRRHDRPAPQRLVSLDLASCK